MSIRDGRDLEEFFKAEFDSTMNELLDYIAAFFKTKKMKERDIEGIYFRYLTISYILLT
jgi:hypothetical protein